MKDHATAWPGIFFFGEDSLIEENVIVVADEKDPFGPLATASTRRSVRKLMRPWRSATRRWLRTDPHRQQCHRARYWRRHSSGQSEDD